MGLEPVAGLMTLMLLELELTPMAPTTTHQLQQPVTPQLDGMAIITHRLQPETPRQALMLMEHGLPLPLLVLGTQLEAGTQMLPQPQTEFPLTSELSKIEPTNYKL